MLSTKLLHFFLLLVCCSITFTLLSLVQGSFSFTLVLGHPAVYILCSWRDLHFLAVIGLLSANLFYFGVSTTGSIVLHKAQVTLLL